MDNILFRLQNLSSTENVRQDNVDIRTGLSQNDRLALQILDNLKPNDVLTGVVSEIDGKTATVLLDNNVTVSALLNSEVSLNKGTPIMFEVEKDSSNSVTLRPLFTNIANQNLAEAALKEADIPINDKSLSMLSSMIDKGLSIDKESISSMYRTALANNEVPVKEIVTMKSIGLPVNSENIAKFDAVVHFENKITDSIESLIEDVPKELENLFENDKDSFYKLADSVLSKDFSALMEIASKEKGDINQNPSYSDNVKTVEDILKLFQNNNSKEIPGEDNIKSANKQQVIDLAKEILFDINISDDIKKEVLKSSVLKEAVKENLSKEWLIKPEDFKDSKTVSEHYDKLLKVCDNLTQILGNELKGSEELMKSVSNFRENVDFLNNLNEMAPYVQIPMRMGDDANTGDLYVYAKKKNLLDKSENLTALLRLDMKYLGSVEVYVKLSGKQNISTDFRFEKEESLILIEKNIHLLNERLEKYGYSVNNSFGIKDGISPVFEDDRESVNDDDVINICKFDVRA